ncbi:hypothetical protein L873DRAFT_1802875 [Choiromyces venosus 120613-1]|uniref:Uncharacterized protein n=1 Tax=Choiromyces venosus 120613-1 TaxID=1336337 RepID=A0A3N4JUI2_9PEZI|nr:hypothetical protein L873DRAFT_1802875 [Choiromyces venosus 120613-1]
MRMYVWWGASRSIPLPLTLFPITPSIISPTIPLLPNPYPFPSLHYPVVCSVCGICCILACLYREQVKLECVLSFHQPSFIFACPRNESPPPPSATTNLKTQLPPLLIHRIFNQPFKM